MPVERTLKSERVLRPLVVQLMSGLLDQQISRRTGLVALMHLEYLETLVTVEKDQPTCLQGIDTVLLYRSKIWMLSICMYIYTYMHILVMKCKLLMLGQS